MFLVFRQNPLHIASELIEVLCFNNLAITRGMDILSNRPRSIYQYSSMAPRLSGQNCKFFKLLLSLNSQKRLGYKENNTKYRILTRKPRSHVRILIYRTWPIASKTSLLMISVYLYCMLVSISFDENEIALGLKQRCNLRDVSIEHLHVCIGQNQRIKRNVNVNTLIDHSPKGDFQGQ